MFRQGISWVVPPESERREKSESNEWFMFRNRLEVTADPDGILRICADSKYWLYVNGERMVREGGLKRGPLPDASYFEEIDISDLLNEGSNTIAVLVWYFGRHGFSHRDSGTPGLLVDGDGIEFSTWKVKTHPAYFDAGYARDAYRLPENSVGFDARYDIPGWMDADFDDSVWSDAVVAGKPGEAPWGPLEKREFDPWFWSDAKAYEWVEARKSDGPDGATYYHCKLPYNAHVVSGLVLGEKTRAGIRIEMTPTLVSNCLSPVYITGDGEQRYESNGWVCAEEIVYTVPSGAAVVEGFFYRETTFPTTFAGSFECNEPLFNTLWEMSRRTLVVNMRDNFMDCPCRERAQWPGDLVVQLGQIPYCFDRAADLLVKKGIRETLRWQREDGVIYGPVPEGNWRMELPAQMLSVVSRYGIWTYFMNTGDSQTLEELYPLAKRYLDIWKFQPHGLIQYRPDEKGAGPVREDGVEVGTWAWIDWGEKIDCEPALNAWFILAAEGVRKMAEQLGFDADVLEIGQKEQRVRDAFRKTYWNTERGGFVSDGFEFKPDDRVQALAVLSGAASTEHYPALKTIFATVEESCPYMEKYVIEALFEMGETNAAIDRMARRFRSMAENEHSTLSERWPEVSDHPGTNNHAWSGGPLTMMSEKIAGLQPLEPGWSRFAVNPQPGTLSRISAMVPAEQGDIRLTMEKTGLDWNVELMLPEKIVAVVDLSALGHGDTFTLRVQILANSTARIFIPAEGVQEDGVPVETAPGITAVEQVEGCCVVSVGSGEYHFKATRKNRRRI